MAWQHNVEKAIAERSLDAWKAAGNAPGKPHKPYRLPEIAEAMLTALNQNDEAEGKRLLSLDRTGALSLV